MKNKRIWVVGSTGIGKTTLVKKLNEKGYISTTEFDDKSHTLMTDLTHEDYQSEGMQCAIAGLKFSHIMSSKDILIFERSMIDNLVFFVNEKYPEATRINKMFHKRIIEEGDNLFLLIKTDWETNKQQIIGRGRPNEQSREALDFYLENHNKYKNHFEDIIMENGHGKSKVVTLDKDQRDDIEYVSKIIENFLNKGE